MANLAGVSDVVKVAVLGVGGLGQHHARIYTEMEQAGDVVDAVEAVDGAVVGPAHRLDELRESEHLCEGRQNAQR